MPRRYNGLGAGLPQRKSSPGPRLNPQESAFAHSSTTSAGTRNTPAFDDACNAIPPQSTSRPSPSPSVTLDGLVRAAVAVICTLAAVFFVYAAVMLHDAGTITGALLAVVALAFIAWTQVRR